MSGTRLHKNHKTEFIAEIASSHNGSIKNLNKLIKKLSKTQVNYIKLQIFDHKELCHKSSKLFKILKRIEISYQNWEKILDKQNKKIILEPFDYKSYLFCKKYRSQYFIKVSSSQNQNHDLIIDAIENFKKVFINISGYSLNDLKKFIKKYKNHKKRIVFMHGFQSFPTDLEKVRLNFIEKISELSPLTGYADHTNSGMLVETYLTTQKAIDFGAKFIEKHVILKRSKKLPDYITSFETEEFKKFMNYFNKNYKIYSKSKITLDEVNYVKQMNIFAVTKEKIFKNEIFSFKKIKFLRINGNGISREKIKSLIKKKKKAKNNIEADTVIKNYFVR